MNKYKGAALVTSIVALTMTIINSTDHSLVTEVINDAIWAGWGASMLSLRRLGKRVRAS